MAKFATLFTEDEIVQPLVAQITWSHHVVLMDKVKDREVYLWYTGAAIKSGWSKNVLIHQIECGLYARQTQSEKISDFESRLPSPKSELAVQTMKDPYNFDFIPFREDMVERDIL